MKATFELLAAANSTIKTTPIKGKEYAMVNERIKAFRMMYPGGEIETKMLSNEDGMCVFKAVCRDEFGRSLGTGHAYERETASQINKTSYIENCETSAVGRALANCGFGIDVSIASYEEVEQAIANQPINEVTARALLQLLDENDIKVTTILRLYKVKSIEELSDVQHRNIHENLDKIFDKQKEFEKESGSQSETETGIQGSDDK